MRKYIFGLAIPALSACLFSADKPASEHPRPGTYRGDHGVMTRTTGLESELTLAADGSFRYFLIHQNNAGFTAKGSWTTGEAELVWTDIRRAFYYHGAFREWDTLELPDTSYLRNVTDTGFERLEVTYDTQFVNVARWVRYSRIEPESLLPEGAYEFAESYADGVDPTVKVAGLTRLEIERDGLYIQRVYRNGVLLMTEEDSAWTQAGTFLITTRNRHCGFEPGYAACGDAPSDYEYVARLANVGETRFRLWMGPDYTYQPKPFWAVFRKAE